MQKISSNVKEISAKLHPISRKFKEFLGQNQRNLNGVLWNVSVSHYLDDISHDVTIQFSCDYLFHSNFHDRTKP